MTALYQLDGSSGAIIRLSDDARIPSDARNSDYKVYLAWVALGNVAQPSAAPTPDTTLALVLATGIAVTSTGTPSLSASYALDAISQAQLFQIGTFAKAFGFFPSGASTQAYPDGAGIPHTFTTTQFVNLLLVCAAYVSAAQTTAAILDAGGSTSWPTASATIA